jgi:hypothetical protein
MDAQIVEVIGRHRLIADLMRAGLEVAEPVRDRGIDLIAYADRDDRLTAFAACPIQMKAFSGRAFNLDAKYAHFPNLIIAYLWNVDSEAEPTTFALTYPEALAVADSMKWTASPSWTEGRRYATTAPSKRLIELLEPFAMTPTRWWQKVTGQITQAAV